jgi:hypothetical protein
LSFRHALQQIPLLFHYHPLSFEMNSKTNKPPMGVETHGGFLNRKLLCHAFPHPHSLKVFLRQFQVSSFGKGRAELLIGIDYK